MKCEGCGRELEPVEIVLFGCWNCYVFGVLYDAYIERLRSEYTRKAQ